MNELRRNWTRHLAVIVGYMLVRTAFYPFSDGHMSLYAGLRLSSLLVLPYRYWPTVVACDVFCLTQNVIECGAQFGIRWVLLDMIPGSITAMPVIWWCRERLNLFPNRRQINFMALFVAAAGVAATWTLMNCIAMTTVKDSKDTYPMSLVLVLTVFIGQYVGMLAVLPWPVMARAAWMSRQPLQQRLRSAVRPLFAIDTLILLASTALCLFLLSRNNHNDVRHIALMVIFIPMVWLLVKQDWRAVAVAGTPCLLFIAELIDSEPTPTVLQVEGFIALCLTGLFALGARISSQQQQKDRERREARQAILLARQSMQLNEARLRKTAQALELMGSALNLSHHQLLARFRHQMPANEAQRYYRQASSTRSQVNGLADSMHPSAWRERGLPAALRETIARVLAGAGVAYRCEIKGYNLHQLTPNLHTAIYRLACESVAYVNTQMICSSVRLHLREGTTRQVRWAMLCVEGSVETSHINDAVYDVGERQFLASKLGAYGLDLEALRNHAQLFGGLLHERTTAKGVRVTCLLVDEQPLRQVQRNHVSLPVNPWIA
ncbi:MASE1 domain-containing protein [Dyella acidiphila]|uniref:MASE1 domain-containing protein n=1 Tax=Dyella acidiphila TaxID=2775866 RepID=A0ABR9G606_9GAMM|nr:MASE1 domain-containing protein [Dyella acidiphila]MBE1159473.1 MASE1 domain-containing protein [Dyella acidiphila]